MLFCWNCNTLLHGIKSRRGECNVLIYIARIVLWHQKVIITIYSLSNRDHSWWHFRTSDSTCMICPKSKWNEVFWSAMEFCFSFHTNRTILTPSSLPCSKWTAPARCIPGRNHTGCVSNKRSNSPKSHGGLVESPEVSLVDVSPSAKMPPSELDTNDARDWKENRAKIEINVSTMYVELFVNKMDMREEDRDRGKTRAMYMLLCVAVETIGCENVVGSRLECNRYNGGGGGTRLERCACGRREATKKSHMCSTMHSWTE